jgi:hypothetical protein
VADLPSKPSSAPDFIQSETTTTSIRVSLGQVIADGGSEIFSYHLQRTQTGGSTFFDVIGAEKNQTTARQFLVQNLEKGKAYRFRYRVVNLIGASPWSDESYLTPAT